MRKDDETTAFPETPHSRGNDGMNTSGRKKAIEKDGEPHHKKTLISTPAQEVKCIWRVTISKMKEKC